MKKIFLLIFCLLFIPNIVQAAKPGVINKNDTLIASEANKTVDGCNYMEEGSYSSIYASPNGLRCLDANDDITLVSEEKIPSTIEECKEGYYNVSYTFPISGKTYTGYVCADNITFEVDTEKYKEEFAQLGFPESYFDKLTILKTNHPNWIFTPYKTGLKWNDVVINESTVGLSYIQVPDLSKGMQYISLDEGSYDPISKTYIVREGINWYAANSNTVAYYLDPRNFLTDKEIFMFENLGYNSNYQTLEVVQKTLINTSLYDFSNHYMDAATYNGNSISPVSLAARSRQEVVLGNGTLSDSASGQLFKERQVYNFYNIGAYSSGCKIDGVKVTNPIMCGLQYAYNRNWFDQKTAILEGSKIIADGYINQKQNTLYFQKWNVTSNIYGNYSNQYMTNIQAALSEANTAYNSYSKIEGLLDSEIEFLIPIYEEMPDQTTLPTNVDNEKLEELEKQLEETKKDINIIDIINSSGYIYHIDYLSGISIGTKVSDMKNKLINTSENVKIEITSATTEGTSILEDDKILGTGDVITLSVGDKKESYRIVIYGDVNGDGIVSAVDYVKIKNYIMTTASLNGSYKIAADVNQDNSISAVDYVNIKNYIMGGNSVLK